MDISKAYDTVDHLAHWKVLGKLDCSSKFTNLIGCFHEGMKGRVQSSGSTSVSFVIIEGLKQDCVGLRPYLTLTSKQF